MCIEHDCRDEKKSTLLFIRLVLVEVEPQLVTGAIDDGPARWLLCALQYRSHRNQVSWAYT